MLSIGKFFSTIFVLLIILTSLAAIGIYSIYTARPGPKFIRNQFIGLWLSVHLLFYSLQSLYLCHKNPHRFLRVYAYADLFYFTLAIVCGSLCAIFHFLSHRIDSCLFSTLLVFTNLLNFLIIINRHLETKAKNKYTEYIDFIKTSSFITLEDSFIKKTLRFINILLKILFLFGLILITNGSLMNSLSVIKFGPRGVFFKVFLSDKSNRLINIHVVCDGAKNDNQSVFLIEGDLKSSHADLVPIQKELVKLNRRVCIWDKAGLGYSDFFYADMHDHNLYYANFLKSIAESKVVLVGMADGADLVLKYADKVKNMQKVILVDAFPTRLKWHAERVARNWSHIKFKEQIKKFIDKKNIQINLINAIGVPFGLVPSFLQSKNFHFDPETNLLMLNEKIWSSEKMCLNQLLNQTNQVIDFNVFNFSISHVITTKSNDQIYERLCAPKKQHNTSRYCLYEQQLNEYLINERKKMTKNGQIYECNYNDCSFDYVVKNSKFFAKALVDLNPF